MYPMHNYKGTWLKGLPNFRTDVKSTIELRYHSLANLGIRKYFILRPLHLNLACIVYHHHFTGSGMVTDTLLANLDLCKTYTDHELRNSLESDHLKVLISHQ